MLDTVASELYSCDNTEGKKALFFFNLALHVTQLQDPFLALQDPLTTSFALQILCLGASLFCEEVTLPGMKACCPLSTLVRAKLAWGPGTCGNEGSTAGRSLLPAFPTLPLTELEQEKRKR